VTDGASDAPVWGRTDRPLATVARNVATRYAAIVADTIIGLMLLPFNVAHLGQSAYGLWLLTASITAYFSVLDLGYGGALVRFVSRYRAWRDARALNEIVSTLFVVFAAFGAVMYLGAMIVARHMDRLFAISPAQAALGESVLLIVALQVALSFPFAVYGGVINGFQRYDANCLVALATSVTVAVVNVTVLSAGYGLVDLVTATTAVRLAALGFYRLNAYRVFPALRVRPSLFRSSRLREASAFSVYNLIIDWAQKLNYSIDPVVIGVFLGSAPVAVWGVAEKIAGATQRLTNQLNTVLFPAIVDSDALENRERLRRILIDGTRISIASVVPIAAALVMLANPLVRAWVGRGFEGSVLLVQLLAIASAVRVSNATASTILKGAGEHRYVALTNLGTGAANVLLSVLLVKPLGLAGVALATIVTVAFTAAVLQFPAACGRVGLALPTAWSEAVWPALWPAAAIVLILAATRMLAPPRLAAVAAQAALGALAYLVVFTRFALTADERRRYLTKARQLWGRRLPAAA
jgi:O-antigen/teichoic acid export membrane protein